MRTGTRVSPSWPGLGPEAGYVEADRSRRTRRNHLQRGGPYVFKILDRARRLSVVARPGREFAVAHRPELPAECLLGDRDAEFLKYPLRQIDQPPAHHAVDRRDRTTFDHAGKCSTLTVVELGWLPRRLAVQGTMSPACVDAQYPVPYDLRADPADLRCLRACPTVIDCRKSQKSAGLRAILRLSRKPAQLRCIKIPA